MCLVKLRFYVTLNNRARLARMAKWFIFNRERVDSCRGLRYYLRECLMRSIQLNEIKLKIFLIHELKFIL